MSTSTIKNLAIAFVCMVGAAGVFGFMVYTVGAQGALLAEQMDNFQTQQANEATYQRLQRLTAETEEERALLQSYFLLQEGDSIDLLNFIEKLAPGNGVSITTKGLVLTKDTKDTANTPQWIEVSFLLGGSRDRIQSFIETLENIPYVSRLTKVELKSLSGNQWQADVTMRVSVLAYDK